MNNKQIKALYSEIIKAYAGVDIDIAGSMQEISMYIIYVNRSNWRRDWRLGYIYEYMKQLYIKSNQKCKTECNNSFTLDITCTNSKG